MDLVYIYGPSAVGKLTVASEIVRRTGYKLFHNHLSIAAIEPVFDFGSETFWRLVHQIRLDVMQAAAREEISLVYTGIYEHPKDLPLVRERFGVVEAEGGRVCLVKLTCEMRVRETRVEAEERRALRKLADLDSWRRANDAGDRDSLIPGRESLRLDNTDLSPGDAATRIIEHYNLVAS